MKEIDWSNLSFGYMKTDYNVRINFREGEWGKLEISSSELINLHMAATCLHYGQEAFEGLKAFRGKDGKVRIFRLEENAARLQSTCRGIMMAELPTERFKEAVLTAVKMVFIKSVVTMQPVCVPATKHMQQGIPQSFIWMQRRRSTSTSVALPTSSE